MGLDLIPNPDPCVVRRKAGESAEGYACPLSGVSKYQGMLGTDCWCRGKGVAHELSAFGYEEEANRLYGDFTDEEAAEFAGVLSAIAEELEQTKPPSTGGARWGESYNFDTKSWEGGTQSTLAEALDTIRDAAGWFKAVSAVGSGVEAWS